MYEYEDLSTYKCSTCGKRHLYGFTCPKEEAKALRDSFSSFSLPIIDLKPVKVRLRCSECGKRYDSDDGHFCSPPIEIKPLKPLDGPGTKPVSEWLRERHAPPRGTDARQLFDYCCPPPVVFGFGGQIIKVN